jgi:negative regulator of genetic competence, sporulation and motility
VLFRFDGLEGAIRAAAGVHGRLAQRIHKSSLYRVGDAYRLVIYPLDYADRLSVAFLSEYSEPIAEGDLAAAHTEEYGKELIRGNAIEVLASLSC